MNKISEQYEKNYKNINLSNHKLKSVSFNEDQWLRENMKAIKNYNHKIKENGSFGEKFKMF
jgi:post-segregation antitoxin (ccd killing protein)